MNRCNTCHEGHAGYWPSAIVLVLAIGLGVPQARATPADLHAEVVLANESGPGGPTFACEDVAIDPLGRITFTDPLNKRVAVVESDGTLRTYAGGAATQNESQPLFSHPLGIAIGPSGVFYVADSDRNQVVGIVSEEVNTIVAGSGSAGFAGDGGLATGASLDRPTDVAVGTDGTLYVVDSNNLRIRRVSTEGTISTVAVLQQETGAYQKPKRVLVLPDGSLLITTEYPERIVRIGVDGSQANLSLGSTEGEALPLVALAVNNDALILREARNIVVAGLPSGAILEGTALFHPVDPGGNLFVAASVAYATNDTVVLCDQHVRRILRASLSGGGP